MSQVQEPHANIMASLYADSPFLAALTRYAKTEARSRLFGNVVRSLTRAEIVCLETHNNHCSDWNLIAVAPNFTPDLIFGCFFSGECVMGSLHGAYRLLPCGILLPAGIYNARIHACEIGNGCHIHNVTAMRNVIVDHGATLAHVGMFSCRGETTFSNGSIVDVGIESGGRPVAICADLTIALAHTVAIRRHDYQLLEAYDTWIKTYCVRAKLDYSIVGAGALVCNTASLCDVYIDPGVSIDGATGIDTATILSSEAEPTIISHGALVRASCIGAGCEISDMAIVDRTLLTEHVHVTRHAKVTQSIVGANTHIAEGEITASLVGPFVGFHHQALLIAAMWPEGKGNVAYGANVGSNHTGKAPDQEIFCGEGTFFGLDTCIKFPADLTGSPYTIIASGVTTLAQRLEFPFSLINSPAVAFDGVPAGYNELFPAWMLSENMYALKRNEEKFRSRNKARRTPIATDIFRPSIIELMRSARDRLAAVTEVHDWYSHEQIGGIGANFITDETRVRALNTYHFYIEFYVLNALLKRYDSLAAKGATPDETIVYGSEAGNSLWLFERSILIAENLTNTSIADHFIRLIAMHREVAETIHASKKRDDIRGKKIIGERYDAHIIARNDPVVIQSENVASTIISHIEALLAKRC